MNILLVCNAGMSTSFVVTRMRKAMKEMSIEGRVEAHASMDIQRYINDFDLVMIAPHLQYLKSEIEEICEKNGKKAVFVPSQSYGSMDGVSIMNFALEIMKEES